jgi:hypothetical protein
VLDLCLSGYVDEIVAELASFSLEIREDNAGVNHEIREDNAGVNHDRLMFLLRIIIISSQNFEFVALFTNAGGGKYLKFLVNDGDSVLHEDARELVYEAYGLTSAASTIVAAASDIMPDRFTFSSSNKNNNEYTIWLHKTTKTMHNEGMKATGYVMWSAAIILSQLLCDFHYLTHNKSVLEVGAGLGICSFMASNNARKVVMSDYNELVLQNLTKNIRLNCGKESLGGTVAVTHANCVIEAAMLDWDNLRATNIDDFQYKKCICDSLHVIDCRDVHVSPHDHLSEGEAEPSSLPTPSEQYDVIIGSDMCCCETDAVGIAKIVQNYLSPIGTHSSTHSPTHSPTHSSTAIGIVLFVVPLPQHRYGTEVIIPALNAIKGMNVRYSLFSHSSCTTSRTVDEVLMQWRDQHSYRNNTSLEPALFDKLDFDALTNSIHDKEYVSFMLIVAKRL